MSELPNSIDELSDLLRAAEELLTDLRKARRVFEDAVREYVVWLFEPRRFDRRRKGIGTFSGNDPYSLNDFKRARKLPLPVHLYRMGDIDERLRPFLDWYAIEKVQQQLETFWQSAAGICLERGGLAEDYVTAIAEQLEMQVKQLRDSIILKRNSVTISTKIAPTRMNRKVARDLAEKHIARNGWPGFNALATLVGCSKSTLRKAIEESPQLLEAEVNYNELRPVGKIRQMADATRDSLAAKDVIQTDDEDDTGSLFYRLLAQARPSERGSSPVFMGSKRED